MNIACFGDSLTFGSIGHSYIKFLRRNRIGIINNKGINGDTTVCMLKRLKRYIDKPSAESIDLYIICIGTNDLLLPYLATVSTLWKMLMIPRAAMMQCIEDDNLFQSRYGEIINDILAQHKEIIALGLPYTELCDYPNERVDKRNKLIRRLAQANNICFIDVAEIQREIDSNGSKTCSWKNSGLLRLLEGIALPVFPGMKDRLSEMRMLKLTVDGVHWNSQVAKAVAARIISSISKET